MTPWAAARQLGPYVLLAPIGSGGMGEVWKARDTRLDRIVAIKRLKAHSERFEQEARAIAALNHPNICQIHDVGSDYLVLEFIEGKPLRGPLPPEETLRLALQVAGALEAAHRKNIIHRDLKPANILVTEDRSVKLLDFGLAKLVTASDDDATRTIEGTVMGTAAYMAPEQAQGKPLDERADIFSFGAVLYEMLSGARAFGGNSTADVLSAILRDEPRPLAAPAALERIVSRCLRKAPADRFQSSTELKSALSQVSLQADEQQPSIAVLPFANMSGDKENEYFSDGLAEEIINELAQIAGLKVTARTSAFAFRGKEQDITKIAETLRVRTVLEGSVRRSGSRIRVTAQLINAADGYHLWSQRYDRDMTDVFAIQDEIAQAIAQALRVKLTPKPAAHRRYTPRLPAYEAYLRARHHQWQLTTESLERGRECFEQAIALDPQFALAYCGLADFYSVLGATNRMPASQAVPRSRDAARKALEIDPSLAEAQAMLGRIAGFLDYDWQEAERRFTLALAHEPVPPQVRHWYGLFYLQMIGLWREALEEHERALREDPLNAVYRVGLASCLLRAGRDAEALLEMRRVLELDPAFAPARYFGAMIHATRGEFSEGLALLGDVPPLGGSRGLQAALLMRTGNRSRAHEILQQLGSGETELAATNLAVFHFIGADIEQGFDWVEKAVQKREATTLLLLGPITNALRIHPRWAKLTRMMNLPETAITAGS